MSKLFKFSIAQLFEKVSRRNIKLTHGILFRFVKVKVKKFYLLLRFRVGKDLFRMAMNAHRAVKCIVVGDGVVGFCNT